jgi:hypothetical protein
MTTRVSTFSLRLPISLKAAVEKMAAEKLSAITTAEAFFAERKARGDREAAIRFLTRAGGEPPRPGDEMPG